MVCVDRYRKEEHQRHFFRRRNTRRPARPLASGKWTNQWVHYPASRQAFPILPARLWALADPGPTLDPAGFGNGSHRFLGTDFVYSMASPGPVCRSYAWYPWLTWHTLLTSVAWPFGGPGVHDGRQDATTGDASLLNCVIGQSLRSIQTKVLVILRHFDGTFEAWSSSASGFFDIICKNRWVQIFLFFKPGAEVEGMMIPKDFHILEGGGSTTNRDMGVMAGVLRAEVFFAWRSLDGTARDASLYWWIWVEKTYSNKHLYIKATNPPESFRF